MPSPGQSIFVRPSIFPREREGLFWLSLNGVPGEQGNDDRQLCWKNTRDRRHPVWALQAASPERPRECFLQGEGGLGL